MKIRQTEASETRRPAAALMDLNVGRLTAREALALFGVSSVALAAASVGGLLWWLSVPATNGALAALAFFGVGLATLGATFAVVVARLGIVSWSSFEQRLADWHDAALSAYEGSEGAETTRVVSQWELSANEYRDMLLVALAVHSRVLAGDPTPWSVRALDGAVWLAQRRLGDVNDAENVSRALADSGLVIDRAPRRAGRWAASSYDEVIQIMERGWKG